MSRSSLCLLDGNPPREQLRACSTENCLPHTQLDGRIGGCHPYLRQRASLKAPLCSAKPCSVIGRAESQLDAPFSPELSIDLWRFLGTLSDRLVAMSVSYCLLALLARVLALLCKSLVPAGVVDDC